MGIRKVSVSLDEHAAAVAERLAAAEGLSLSAWLSRAALREARIADGLAAVAEWEADNGPLSEDGLAAARAELARSDAFLSDPAVQAKYRAALRWLYAAEDLPGAVEDDAQPRSGD